VDRLGRSLQDLVGFLTEIHALGVNLFLHQQGIDTTTPAGKALFQMMGVFAEFGRAMIQDRVRAGLERAKAQGKVLGRPSMDAGKVEAIKADLKAGGGTSKSILFSRNFSSYRPRPRPRSHPPTSMAASHGLAG
jgi:DNA invertase Pin-like site-specific DNA recombinase